jgi:transposase
MCTAPQPRPKEFRADVVAVARRREPRVLLNQIAADFGITESCLRNWMHAADVADGHHPGVTPSESAELREANRRTGCSSRRTRCCAARRRTYWIGRRGSGAGRGRIAVNALVSAERRRGDVAGCAVHSHRGSQFRSRKVLAELHRHGLVGSLGRVRENVLNRRRWSTREDLRLAIVTWSNGPVTAADARPASVA